MYKAYMPGLPGIARDRKCRTARRAGEWNWGDAALLDRKKDIISCAELKGNPDGFLIILRVRNSDPPGQERGTT